MSDGRNTPPGVMFSHYGIYVTDVERLEEFYTRVLGFAVSDAGMAGLGCYMSFMTRRPREHHQFVLGGGRDAAHPTTSSEVGFKAPDLDELRRLEAMLEAEDGVGDITAIDHGIAWTLYFRDPEGIRSAVSVDTGWYVPQPQARPLDLSRSDADIARETEAWCRATPGFRTRAEWRADNDVRYRADGRLTIETPETGNAEPSFERPSYPGRVLLRTAENTTPPPRIALSHVGYYAIDLPALAEFYTRALGYAVTGEGRMPAIGAEPERDYVYLSRDPGEHQQVVLVSGRDAAVPSSINQLSLRITSLDELRQLEARLENEPGVTSMRHTCHGNSFSIYVGDPEGNEIELAVESTWYVPAPHGAPLDLSWSDEALIAWAEDHCRETPGFMMRADWKARARAELIANGHLEAEGLVSHVA